MLSYQLLKNHAGVMLIGDYTSFRCLHQVVHDVNERSPLIKVDDGPFLGLAYEVRKAYDQLREVLPPTEHYPEMGVRYGVKLLWPVVMLQQRMLRLSLSYIDHPKRHQAVTYALEAVIEDGLKEDFGVQSSVLIDLWQRLDPRFPDTMDKLDSRGAVFCSWSKTQRKAQFAALLESFGPTYESYNRIRTSNGETALLTPQLFEAWAGREWSDPRW